VPLAHEYGRVESDHHIERATDGSLYRAALSNKSAVRGLIGNPATAGSGVTTNARQQRRQFIVNIDQ
jgi:hypothetical protein